MDLVPFLSNATVSCFLNLQEWPLVVRCDLNDDEGFIAGF